MFDLGWAVGRTEQENLTECRPLLKMAGPWPFWPFLASRAHSRPVLDHFCWPWSDLDHFLTILDCLCRLLTNPPRSWPILTNPARFWPILASPDWKDEIFVRRVFLDTFLNISFAVWNKWAFSWSLSSRFWWVEDRWRSSSVVKRLRRTHCGEMKSHAIFIHEFMFKTFKYSRLQHRVVISPDEWRRRGWKRRHLRTGEYVCHVYHFSRAFF